VAKLQAKEIAKTSVDALASDVQTAERIMKGNTEALSQVGAALSAAIEKLTRAYQDLATRTVKNLTAAMEALAKVKSPTEFVVLQQTKANQGGR
jgi:hypothetical protein